MTARALPGAGDDGQADPELLRRLDAVDGSASARAAVLAAAVDARLFVPITATATAEHVEPASGLRAESSAEMALVSLLSDAGERALPAFLDVASLQAWRSDVRPVPVGLAYLSRAALDDGATAVVLDPFRVHLVLRGPELTALADGYVPVPGSALSFRRTTGELRAPASTPDPALLTALAAALRPERLRSARLLEGPAGPVLGVCPRDDLDPAALASLAQRVLTRLGPALPAGGLDLAVVPPGGAGHALRVGRWR